MSPLQFFKCMSDDTRLKCVLIISQLEEACVCDLMAALELDQPKVSRHLAELRKCNILQDERRGKWVYYKLDQQLSEWAKEVIRQTADNNSSYFAAPLSILNASKRQTPFC